MVEHGMRTACLAAFNFETSHELFNANIETGEVSTLASVSPDKWRSVLVSLYCEPFTKRFGEHACQPALGACSNMRSLHSTLLWHVGTKPFASYDIQSHTTTCLL